MAMPPSSSPFRSDRRSWRQRWAIPALTLGLLSVCGTAFSLVAGCSSSNDAPAPSSSCPANLPASCPSPPPSYATDVKPIIAERCFPCHAPGGAGVGSTGRDFSQYDTIHTQRSAVLNQIYSCNMPPPDAGAPTSDQRDKLLAWLVCGAPDN